MPEHGVNHAEEPGLLENLTGHVGRIAGVVGGAFASHASQLGKKFAGYLGSAANTRLEDMVFGDDPFVRNGHSSRPHRNFEREASSNAGNVFSTVGEPAWMRNPFSP